MNPVLFFLLFPTSVELAELLQQARSRPSWGVILSILLILALVILWWLLGPGAKRRRHRMTDLLKPVQTTPAAQATPAIDTPAQPASPPPAVRVDEPVAQSAPVEAPDEPADEVSPTEAAEVPDETAADDPTDESSTDESSADESSMEVALSVDPDDLRKIEGIGPKVAGILNANGIVTFAQLAETSVESLMGILEAEGLKFMKPDTWPEQAAFAAKGDWDGLQGLRDRLKGEGRNKE